MADINWIKLRVDMFDDEKIKIIQSMPEGDAILVIWIRIIALAGKCNAKGLVLIEDEFPYSDEMLATIFNKPLATVRLALGTFEKFRMIERTEKGIYISNFEKHQNTEGENQRTSKDPKTERTREKTRASGSRQHAGASGQFFGKSGNFTGKRDRQCDKSRDVTRDRA